jgi:hypothetical protein
LPLHHAGIGPDSKRAAMLARLGELVINAYR